MGVWALTDCDGNVLVGEVVETRFGDEAATQKQDLVCRGAEKAVDGRYGGLNGFHVVFAIELPSMAAAARKTAGEGGVNVPSLGLQVFLARAKRVREQRA